jgi:polar amino acid transport system substrate-binding protein
MAVACLNLAQAGARADVMADIAERGILRVGTTLNIPWAMRDSAGEPMGFEIDNAARLANDLGVELELVELPFDALLDALEAGTVDVVAAGLSITPERALRAAFSDPYMIGDVSVVVRVADLDRYDSLMSLDDPAVTAATVAGTTTELAIARSLPSVSLGSYATVSEAIQAFLDGEVTALVAETPIPELLLAENQEVFAILPDPLYTSAQAFAVARGEHTFRTFLDNWIVASEIGGTLESARFYWFGGRDWLPRLDRPLFDIPIEDVPAEPGEEPAVDAD